MTTMSVWFRRQILPVVLAAIAAAVVCLQFSVSVSAQTAPSITSLTPAFGPVGTPVTIAGADFGATQAPVASIAVDVNVFRDPTTASTTLTTPTFSTASPNELLLAFISTDFLSGTNTTVTNVTGGGLTWVLVRRTNVQRGSAEIWRAFAPTVLSNVSVTATTSQSVVSSITLMSFTGVDTTGTSGSGAIGATGSGNANPGAPTATLTTTRAGSWVIGVGNDHDHAIARTVPANQTMIHQYLPAVGDTYWVQRITAPTAVSGSAATINDTAPATDRYNLTICEIRPAILPPSTVTFNGTAATPTSWSATSIVAPVPAGATTGDVIVTVGGLPSAAGVSFAVTAVPPPTITGLAPIAGAVGVPVTITGTNFGATVGTSTVAFNGTPATPTSWSATSIVVPVPAGATTGNVVVTVGGVPSNGSAFTVAPSITSLLPLSGPTGTSVTITGANFGATVGTSTVTFNGTAATPTTWSATSIAVPVPTGATTGNVVVTVGGLAEQRRRVYGDSGAAPTITASRADRRCGRDVPVTITGTNFGATGARARSRSTARRPRRRRGARRASSCQCRRRDDGQCGGDGGWRRQQRRRRSR